MSERPTEASAESRPPWRPDAVIRALRDATADWEFRTFVVGFERSADAASSQAPEALRRLKREVGAALEHAWPERTVDFERPEARLDVARDLSVSIRVAPLFVAGRYRKLSRRMSASDWIHLSCRGRGCEACNYTGSLCGPSVQQIFSGPLLAQTRGETTVFHGQGREDTDARMLGRGRPFVMEVTSPRRRSLDLERLARESTAAADGRCEWLSPAVVAREDVTRVKETAAAKTYRAWIRLDGAPPPDAAERAASLAGVTLAQLSPTRVMHRRGRDTLRPRRVLESLWLGEVDDLQVWEITAESGTYIKELVSGDDGRTTPSLAERLGTAARCVALDVLAIHWTPSWEEEPSPVEGAT